jgi:hypothetical protein
MRDHPIWYPAVLFTVTDPRIPGPLGVRVGVLRDDAGGAAEHAPQPGLDELDGLLDAAREAGTDVRLLVRGAPGPLAAGVDLAAYRIVQEALTNARRHAPGAAVQVELDYGADALRLRDRGGPAAMIIRVVVADDQQIVREASRRCWRPSPTSRWSAAPPTGRRRSASAATSGPTSC